MPSFCCGTSVGGRVRRTTPDGKDKDQATYETAMREEADEELGLKVLHATELTTVHLPNLCSAAPTDPPGHLWTVFDLEVVPGARLLPDAEETRGAEWVDRGRLTAMADATIDFARTGRPAAEQPADSLEAVWVELLHRIGDLTVCEDDRDAVRRLYTTAPPEYWSGGRPMNGGHDSP